MYTGSMMKLTEKQRRTLAEFLSCRTVVPLDPVRYHALMAMTTDHVTLDELRTIDRTHGGILLVLNS